MAANAHKLAAGIRRRNGGSRSCWWTIRRRTWSPWRRRSAAWAKQLVLANSGQGSAPPSAEGRFRGHPAGRPHARHGRLRNRGADSQPSAVAADPRFCSSPATATKSTCSAATIWARWIFCSSRSCRRCCAPRWRSLWNSAAATPSCRNRPTRCASRPRCCRRPSSRFRSLLEAAPDAMVMCREDGEIVMVNSQTEVLFNCRRDKLISRNIRALVPGWGYRFRPGWSDDFGAPGVQPVRARH